MAASNVINLVIQLDNQGANKGLDNTNKGLAGFERQAAQAGAGASRAFENFERTVGRAAVSIENRFNVLRGVLGANALQGLLGQTQQLAQSALGIAGSFERSRIGLEAFLGSADKAKSIFGEIQDFAQLSPFQFKDLAQGANRLLAFNVEAEKVVPTLAAVSSATGALGGDIGKFNDLITALGQIRQAGKLTGEELRQLRNAGVEGVALESLGAAFGKTAAEIQKAVRDGIIPGAQAVDVIVSGLEKRFGPFNEKVSKSFEVALSNVGDSLSKLADTGLGPLLPKLTAFLNGLKPQFESFGQFLAKNADSISEWIAVAGKIAASVAISQIPKVVFGISGAVKALTLSMASNPLSLLATGLGLVAFSVQNADSEFSAFNKSLGFLGIALSGGVIVQNLSLLKIGFTEAKLAVVGLNGAIGGSAGLDFLKIGSSVGVAASQMFKFQGAVTATSLAMGTMLSFLKLIPFALFRDASGDVDRAKKRAEDFGAIVSELTPQFHQVGRSSGELQARLAGVTGAFERGKITNLTDFRSELGALSKEFQAAGKGGLDVNKIVDATLKKQQELLRFNEDAEQQQKRASSAEDRAADLLRQATGKNLEGLQKIKAELQSNLKEYGLTQKAIQDLKDAAKFEGVAFLRKDAVDALKDYGKEVAKQNDNYFKLRQDQAAELAKNNVDAANSVIESYSNIQDSLAEQDIRTLEIRRDRELASLELVGARTVNEKVNLELRKADIEKSFISSSEDLRVALAERQIRRELLVQDAIFDSGKLSVDSYLAYYEAAELRIAQLKLSSAETTTAAIKTVEERAGIAATRLVTDNTDKTFSQIKRSVDGVFDQLVTKSKNVFELIGNVIKTALFSALKEVVSSRIAKSLTQMLSDNRAAQGPNYGSSNGGFGGFFRLLGLGGSLGSFGTSGAPGGTGGFAGPVSSANLGIGELGIGFPSVVGAPGQAGQVAGLTSLLGFAGAKNLLTKLGNIGFRQAGDFGGEAPLKGIGGAKGGAMLAAGGILAFDGLRRGGLVGTLETTAGGALIGAKFGGPIGALIGGAIGLGAGLIRNLFKSANEKAREKIKAIYGVDISSKEILGQVVSIAKQTFGGDLDLAIRSADIRDLVELYALSTGQSARGIAAKIQPVTLSTSGGVTGILQNYSNGQPINIGGSQAAGPTVIQVTLDGASSAAFLQGQTVNAIESNPRAVAGASAAAQQSNLGRQQAAVSQLNPGLLLA